MNKFLYFAVFLTAAAIAACWYIGSNVNTQASDDYSGPYKYYYERLNEKSKSSYKSIIAKIYDMPERIRIPETLTKEELNNVFEALSYDNPDLFFLGTGCSQVSLGPVSYVSFEYTMTKSEYSKALSQLEKERDKIIKETASDDEWHKELSIHDCIVENTEYKYEADHGTYSTAYGALINAEASCEGYSKAFKYLCDSAGIECYVVAGKATDRDGKTDAHMWNVVRVNNNYCQVDLTWDDPVEGTYPTHAYFNVTDSRINLDHTSWHFDYDCTTVSNSYSKVNGLYFTDYSSYENASLARAVAMQIEKGSTAVEMVFATKAAYANACRVLIEEEEIYNVLSTADKLTSKSVSDKQLMVARGDDIYVLTILPVLD